MPRRSLPCPAAALPHRHAAPAAHPPDGCVASPAFPQGTASSSPEGKAAITCHKDDSEERHSSADIKVIEDNADVNMQAPSDTKSDGCVASPVLLHSAASSAPEGKAAILCLMDDSDERLSTNVITAIDGDANVNMQALHDTRPDGCVAPPALPHGTASSGPEGKAAMTYLKDDSEKRLSTNFITDEDRIAGFKIGEQIQWRNHANVWLPATCIGPGSIPRFVRIRKADGSIVGCNPHILRIFQ